MLLAMLLFSHASLLHENGNAEQPSNNNNGQCNRCCRQDQDVSVITITTISEVKRERESIPLFISQMKVKFLPKCLDHAFQACRVGRYCYY